MELMSRLMSNSVVFCWPALLDALEYAVEDDPVAGGYLAGDVVLDVADEPLGLSTAPQALRAAPGSRSSGCRRTSTGRSAAGTSSTRLRFRTRHRPWGTREARGTACRPARPSSCARTWRTRTPRSVTFGLTSVAFLTSPSTDTNVPRCFALSFLYLDPRIPGQALDPEMDERVRERVRDHAPHGFLARPIDMRRVD